MKTCPKCLAQLDDQCGFCTTCGNSFNLFNNGRPPQMTSNVPAIILSVINIVFGLSFCIPLVFAVPSLIIALTADKNNDQRRKIQLRMSLKISIASLVIFGLLGFIWIVYLIAASIVSVA